jgi:hypothetical protein
MTHRTASRERPDPSFTAVLHEPSDPTFLLPAIMLSRVSRLEYDHSPAELSAEISRARAALREGDPIRSIGALVFLNGLDVFDSRLGDGAVPVSYAYASEFTGTDNAPYVELRAVCVRPDFMVDGSNSEIGNGLSAVAVLATLRQFAPHRPIKDRANAVRILLHAGFEEGGLTGEADALVLDAYSMFGIDMPTRPSPVELPENAMVANATAAIEAAYPDLPAFNVDGTFMR